MSTKAQRQLRQEIGVRPAKFAARPQFDAADYGAAQAKRDAQYKRLDRMCATAEGLTPAQAVNLAQRLLVAVDDNGISYADFQSAQAVQKYVGQAIRALRGQSLS